MISGGELFLLKALRHSPYFCALPHNQILGATLKESFESWLHFVQMRHGKRWLAARSLYMWMNQRLRRAFDTLRSGSRSRSLRC